MAKIKLYDSGMRRCEDCLIVYSPNAGRKGKMPKGYKVCPKCRSARTTPIKCTVPGD